MDTDMADTGAQSSRHGQVQVHFITNSPDIELPEGKRQLLVPTSKCITQDKFNSTLIIYARCSKIWLVTNPQF